MDHSQPNANSVSPSLRALALGLLVETVVPMIHKALEEESPAPPREGEGMAADENAVLQALRFKCRELSALVLRADDPEEAAAYVLGFLPKHIDYVFELVHGQKRSPSTWELRSGCLAPEPERRPVVESWYP